MGLPLETALPGIGTGAGKQSLPCVPSGGRRPASGAAFGAGVVLPAALSARLCPKTSIIAAPSAVAAAPTRRNGGGGGERAAVAATQSLWSRLFMTWGQISSENTCDYI